MHPFQQGNPGAIVVDLGGCVATSASGAATDGSGFFIQVTVVNPGIYAQLEVSLWDKGGNLVQTTTPPASCNGKITCVTDPDGISMYSDTPLGEGRL